jgi:hypothetical protein
LTERAVAVALGEGAVLQKHAILQIDQLRRRDELRIGLRIQALRERDRERLFLKQRHGYPPCFFAISSPRALSLSSVARALSSAPATFATFSRIASAPVLSMGFPLFCGALDITDSCRKMRRLRSAAIGITVGEMRIAMLVLMVACGTSDAISPDAAERPGGFGSCGQPPEQPEITEIRGGTWDDGSTAVLVRRADFEQLIDYEASMRTWLHCLAGS